jgi:hypothetical protein
MGKLDGRRVGLRDKDTKELVIAYPYEVSGTDEEISKRVRDWYYQTSCEAEDQLLNSYVDRLNNEEMDQYQFE